MCFLDVTDAASLEEKGLQDELRNMHKASCRAFSGRRDISISRNQFLIGLMTACRVDAITVADEVDELFRGQMLLGRLPDEPSFLNAAYPGTVRSCQ